MRSQLLAIRHYLCRLYRPKVQHAAVGDHVKTFLQNQHRNLLRPPLHVLAFAADRINTLLTHVTVQQ